jgi:hypothetical protein
VADDRTTNDRDRRAHERYVETRDRLARKYGLPTSDELHHTSAELEAQQASGPRLCVTPTDEPIPPCPF